VLYRSAVTRPVTEARRHCSGADPWGRTVLIAVIRGQAYSESLHSPSVWPTRSWLCHLRSGLMEDDPLETWPCFGEGLRFDTSFDANSQVNFDANFDVVPNTWPFVFTLNTLRLVSCPDFSAPFQSQKQRRRFRHLYTQRVISHHFYRAAIRK